MLLLLLLAGRFLLGDGGAAWPFARTRVGVRALAADGKPATMPQTAIRADVHQTLDVHLHTLAQVAFDIALPLDDRADTAELPLVQIAPVRIGVDARLLQGGLRTR